MKTKEIADILMVTANVRKLHNDNQTPFYFASNDRIKEWIGDVP